MDFTGNTKPNITLVLQDSLRDSYVSLVGAGIGGGLFLLVLILGVIFWLSKERDEDDEIRLEAEQFRRGRSGGRLLLEMCDLSDDRSFP